MRIVIDFQGAQAENRNRGIGRYARSLALGIVRNRGQHDVHLVLNGHFGKSVDCIRSQFKDLLPHENFHLWYPTGTARHIESENSWHRSSSELLREAVIFNLQPDIILVTSLFEGLVDDAVTSVSRYMGDVPTAVVLYDLIPYIYPDIYLERPAVRHWYEEKLEYLKKADLQLAISESTRAESIGYLGADPSRVVNISAAIDPLFRPVPVSRSEELDLRNRYDLEKPFLMYTGGIDHRKNIDGLIRAFASLPFDLRNQYQLAIVCAVEAAERDRLSQLAADCGLDVRSLILTDYVSAEDLLILYNLCHLFVFPSWHEGFGLPALEAMACGRAVVGSNRSSLPEVIGRRDALFDPYDEQEITSKLQEVLCNSSFRQDLERHAIEQAAKFSWDKTAKQAISSMERCASSRKETTAIDCEPVRRLKLAYVSPLPPERSGIADYSAELLPALRHYYDIDVVIAQEKVSDLWVNANCQQRSVEWFRANPEHYDRVLYHFGNSTYHQHMFALAKDIPGVVVLHDFFISGLVAHLECHGVMPGMWVDALYAGHGYAALQQRFSAEDTADVVWKFPCNYAVLQDAKGVIVHSPYAIKMADEWYGPRMAEDWECIPLLRVSATVKEAHRHAARASLGITKEQFVVCSFGLLGPNKLNHRLLDAWLASPLAQDERALLVFVGENDGGSYGAKLRDRISKSGLDRRVLITGWADEEGYRSYLFAADVGVQLRAFSRGETSAAVFDCMNCGVATIVNAHGSMGDLASDCVWLMPDNFNDSHLVEALTTLRRDTDKRNALSDTARDIVHTRHKPEACAAQYHKAIERFSQNAKATPKDLICKIAESVSDTPAESEIRTAAKAIDRSMTDPIMQRQLLVDISELAQRDAKSGIQRVVRSILKQWLENPPLGYRIEPVYASTKEPGYRYAREFTLNFLGCPSALRDEPVSYQSGDIFFGLDFQPEVIPAQRDFFETLRRAGVYVKFCVYDLLLIKVPHFFVGGGSQLFSKWLEEIVESDGAVCISKAVADELQDCIGSYPSTRNRNLSIRWFHLGADMDNSVPSMGVPASADEMLSQLVVGKTFLMVGTLEPRKGHEQVVSAFDKLWSNGSDARLVIVGKQGWLVEGLVDRLRSHQELGNRLFWVEGASDEFLEKVYQASTCLIAASYGEGFGLPLIEAAQHKLPIIARDIPVFREVAGKHAYYFDGTEPEGLADSLLRWLELYGRGEHVRSDSMPWLSWKESAERLLSNVISP